MEIPFLIKPSGGQGHYPENLYFEPETETSRAALAGTPGLILWSALGNGETRGEHPFDGHLYAVRGATVFRVDGGGTATACTGTLGTSIGPVYISDNGVEMMIVDGVDGYIVTGTTVTAIADPDFPTPSSLTFQDGYFIITRADTGEIWISGSYDGSTWDALDYATAEGQPDKAVRVFSDHRELWIFGDLTTEIFYNSGDADFPFERIQGAYIETGIGARASAVAADNTLYWVTDKGQIVKAAGYNPQVVSTPEIERRIAGYFTFGDAVGWSYSHGGHTFVVFEFPSGNMTWVYDTATAAWHKWTSFQAGSAFMGRHRGNCYAMFAGKHIVGDYETGDLYEMSSAVYTDNGNAIRAVHVAPVIEQNRKEIFHQRLEIFCKAGVGLASGQGSDPQVMLDWSDNDCRTWSNEHWTGMGKIGEYDTRAVWRRLGKSRSRNYRLTITDPVERVIYGGCLEAEIGKG